MLHLRNLHIQQQKISPVKLNVEEKNNKAYVNDIFSEDHIHPLEEKPFSKQIVM